MCTAGLAQDVLHQKAMETAINMEMQSIENLPVPSWRLQFHHSSDQTPWTVQCWGPSLALGAQIV